MLSNRTQQCRGRLHFLFRIHLFLQHIARFSHQCRIQAMLRGIHQFLHFCLDVCMIHLILQLEIGNGSLLNGPTIVAIMFLSSDLCRPLS